MRVHAIINPSAGGRIPILKILNNVFRAHGVVWDVSVTHGAGDARRLARTVAQSSDVDVVAVCGGDGTLTEVAGGLLGTDVPIAIIPTGTGNVLAAEFGIPRIVRRAAELICSGFSKIKSVDLGEINGKIFMLRASAGFEAAVAQETDRRLKPVLGVMAYGLAALQVLRAPPIANYKITLDGREIVCKGLSCLIANAGSLGRLNLSLAPNIDASDGLLDVIVVERVLSYARLSLAAGSAQKREPPATHKHWQAREVSVVADPPQPFQGDGDPWGETPVKARVLPGAVQMVVPA